MAKDKFFSASKIYFNLIISLQIHNIFYDLGYGEGGWGGGVILDP